MKILKLENVESIELRELKGIDVWSDDPEKDLNIEHPNAQNSKEIRIRTKSGDIITVLKYSYPKYIEADMLKR